MGKCVVPFQVRETIMDVYFVYFTFLLQSFTFCKLKRQGGAFYVNDRRIVPQEETRLLVV